MLNTIENSIDKKYMYHVFCKKKLLLLSIWCLVLITSVKAQPNFNYDSLKTVLSNVPPETTEAALLHVDLANYFVYQNMDSAIYYIDQVFTNSRLLNTLPKNYHRHYLVKAWTQHGSDQLSAAITNYKHAYDLAKLSENRKKKIEVLINLGAAFEQIRDTSAMFFVQNFMAELDTATSGADQEAYILGRQYEASILNYRNQPKEALNVLLSAFEISFLDQYPEYSIGLYNKFAMILKETGNFKTSEKFLKKAMMVVNISDYNRRMNLLSLIELYIKDEQLDSAQVYLSAFKQEKNLTKINQFDYLLVQSEYFMMQDSLLSALVAVDELKKMVAGTDNVANKLTVMVFEGQILASIGKVDKAKRLLRKIKVLLQKNPNLFTEDRKIACNEIEINTALWRRNPRSAGAFKEYQQLVKDKTSKHTDEKLQELSVAYEMEQKENELKVAQQENLIQANELSLSYWHKLGLTSIVICLLAILSAFIMWARMKTAQMEEDKMVLSSRVNEMSAKLAARQMVPQRNVNKPVLEKIAVNTYTKKLWITIDHIMYLEFRDGDTYLTLCNEASDIRSSETLKSLYSKLPNPPFVQIFRTIIINRNRMSGQNNKVVFMENGQKLKISKTFKGNL